MHLVSIIIPNYNHALFLKQRIDSILNQTYEDFELIILDDCSADGSKGIIENYRGHSKITNIVYNKVNSGSTFKQWKKGIQLAMGQYIWFAESDDYAAPEFLESLVPLFNTGNNIGMVFCNSHLVDKTGSITGNTNNWLQSYANVQGRDNATLFKGYKFCLDHLFLLNSIPNASAVLFRKEPVTNNLQWIDTSLKNSGDWKLWISIALNSDLVWLNRDLNYFRKHDNNVTNSLPLLKSEALYILKEITHNENVESQYRLYESLCFWSFNTASWTKDPIFNQANFGIYFKDNVSFPGIVYLAYFLIKQSALYVMRFFNRAYSLSKKA